MSESIPYSTIAYPVMAMLPYSLGANNLWPNLAINTIMAVGATIAAGATANMISPTAAQRAAVLRVFFAATELGGPFLFSMGGAGSFRFRQSPPFNIMLDFGPNGITGTLGTAWTMKNEHATIAVNVDFLAIGSLDVP